MRAFQAQVRPHLCVLGANKCPQSRRAYGDITKSTAHAYETAPFLIVHLLWCQLVKALASVREKPEDLDNKLFWQRAYRCSESVSLTLEICQFGLQRCDARFERLGGHQHGERAVAWERRWRKERPASFLQAVLILGVIR